MTDIIDYIDRPVIYADNADKACDILKSQCIVEYTTVRPAKDSIIFRKRFNVESCYVKNESKLIVPVTSEMVEMYDNDTLLDEIDRIGLDRKRFRI